MLKIAIATLLVSAVVPIGARAAPAPAALLGKSIVLTWSETRQQRTVGEQNFRPVNASHNLSMYVSGAGRVFVRQTIRTGSGTGSGYQVSGSPESNAVPSFVGRTMTLFSPFRSGGMRRHVITFDATFTACTAAVAFAKEVGRETAITGSVINKRLLVEMQSISVANVTCAVQNGNVFGSQ
jgi:hypothetical protein